MTMDVSRYPKVLNVFIRKRYRLLIPRSDSLLFHLLIFRILFYLSQISFSIYPFVKLFDMAEESTLDLEYRGRTAVLTIHNERKLNAFTGAQYYDLAQKLREIATHDEVFTTVILAKGRFFSA